MEWTTIKKYPDYEICSNGMVRRRGSAKPRKTHVSKNNGYVCLSLYAKTFFRLHRLLAETFIPNPENLPFVNHIDGNKLNNELSNLEWCDCIYNNRHAFKLGLINNMGSNNGRSVISEEKAKEISILISKDLTSKEISNITNTSIGIIKNIRRKSSWRFISDLYFDKPKRTVNQHV